ncbi:MAG TPA: hypothetical protein VNJ70_20135, partial [Thermoanaerobaculia bacterium]|nr:hypothetical protein [Thermoanaerobaculia bacterium]
MQLLRQLLAQRFDLTRVALLGGHVPHHAHHAFRPAVGTREGPAHGMDVAAAEPWVVDAVQRGELAAVGERTAQGFLQPGHVF